MPAPMTADSTIRASFCSTLIVSLGCEICTNSAVGISSPAVIHLLSQRSCNLSSNTSWQLNILICMGYSHRRWCEWISGNLLYLLLFDFFNSVQTRCIVKGEAQKSPLFWRFSGGFDFLRIACSLGIPQENL